jgi:hypothetical protein
MLPDGLGEQSEQRITIFVERSKSDMKATERRKYHEFVN